MKHKRFLALFSVLTTAFIMVALMGGIAQAQPPQLYINFQLQGAPLPGVGYIADTGLGYADRGNGQTYGWVTEASRGTANPTPLNLQDYARDRNRGGIAQELDTLIHMQFVTPTRTGPRGAWEIALPVGRYEVTVSVGDEPGNGGIYDSLHQINIEGTTLINAFQATGANEYAQASGTFDVTDGRMTVDAVGGTNTKINYITIIAVNVPDSDGDGVNDLEDACSGTFGEGADGCPIDTDGDGVNNHVDQCDDTPGPASNNGCPVNTVVIDTDGDGWSDTNDACPTTPGVAPDGCPRPVVSNPVLPPDSRMNWQNGDHIAAIYTNDGGVEAYCIDSQSQGQFSLRVDSSALAGIPARPAQNTLVAAATQCPVAFYVLTSGEYQINIGPNADGDVRVMVFDTLAMSNIRYSGFRDLSGGFNPGVPAAASDITTASNGAVTPLSNCRITTLDILNFRESPEANSTVMTMVPFDMNLEAINRTADRFNVIFGDDNGWISADFVTTQGDCGE